MEKEKKTYFVSDVHLGSPSSEKSFEREKKLVHFLDCKKHKMDQLILLGDIFDFWYEYKYVVPKGYYLLFAKLYELRQLNIDIQFFTGNHDMWAKNYFIDELGIKIHYQEQITNIKGKTFFLAHGDGLGKGDKNYKFIKAIFTSPVSQWIYSRFHPNFAFGLANFFSKKSRSYTSVKAEKVETERLLEFATEKAKNHTFDYFVFGHRHQMMEKKISDNTWYYNLGDWLVHFSYGVFDGEKFSLMKWEEK